MKQDIRVQMTRRMLKEGLLRCLSRKPLSLITVSDLSKEAGVNRATFYNHYDTPVSLLKDIANDYAVNLCKIYHTEKENPDSSEDQAILACLDYLYSNREEVKILCSKNAENHISGFGMEIMQEHFMKSIPTTLKQEEALLETVITASATYGLFKVWITNDIRKTPKEILALLKRMVGGNLEKAVSNLLTSD